MLRAALLMLVLLALPLAASAATTLPWQAPSALAAQPDWKSLSQYSGSMTRAEFDQAWEKFYAPASAVLNLPFEVEGDRLRLFPHGEAAAIVIELKKTDQASRARSWRRGAELPPLNNRPPLSDLHIALDPPSPRH